ncbi:hypothetical protein BU24DRAFT_356440 [Aaosphaeria arxii CBS 175.79]|uniref:FHA domain-containing protein n=1 Tax=Aaosphaeria arxii CBS 175.79 TaxID=1450172 RepID=A0A6A5XBX9_9PLEO|nr:uncharacterized protein BU24DRAFT_356440 [Aaosphaeria arxii CBS 175.79]KAF2010420.1 hypothetical protein BU24DRAFT_356440 [Aaosphaeria arxii CBS 175.79]
MERSPEQTKKPSLLPAFEPLSSSPFPRPQSAKRKYNEDSPSYPKQQLKYYPTPVPTSSTGIFPSSSPQHSRAGLAQTISALSERVPLGDVPSLDLPANGDIVRMGRSSNSSDYQLSANRLISRVHVQAAYHGPNASCPHGFVEVECLGWNGAKIHCKGHVYELCKGETYVSENPDSEIMLDVQDARVMILWPTNAGRAVNGTWDSEDDISPTRRPAMDQLASSPPVIPRSPVSQSPIRQPNFMGLGAPIAPAQSPAPVRIFEDDEEAGGVRLEPTPDSPTPAEATFIRTTPTRSSVAPGSAVKDSRSSILSSFSDDFSDNDEENDPVVHSFGPFGDNLLPRLESFKTSTPTQGSASAQRHRKVLRPSPSPKRRSFTESIHFKESPIKNHVINQLAFSRVHSIPLSLIHGNLPAELRACANKLVDGDKTPTKNDPSPSTLPLTKQELKSLMDTIPCVGEIPRSGKDAAGKALENEFYYVPEMDTDPMRREAVTGSFRGTGLRAVRKQHKQYYWKKPRV